MLRVGETVGPYEILARLKAGGMATLFVGQKRGAAGFSRHVAIKVVHEHLANDPEFVRMFVDEALLQARIHHPNVVHVEELGETPSPDGSAVHYLVMEYVYGCSLSQLLDSLARRDRRLSPELAVHIGIQTLAGLHAAHELKDEHGATMGVVHRDVSPQNVLLAYEGHVKLIDFGVAKARNRSQQTTGASIKGKIRYMPPEQAKGASDLDRRADVYALGIVLWEMLAFRKLFASKDDLVLLDMVRNPRVMPPSHFAPGLPPELDRVVMKALAPKVEDRWATAQEFRRALAEALPKAMLVDASHIADLLVAVMSEQMKKDREALPSQLSAVVAGERRMGDNVQADEALHTMTISAAGLAYLSELSIEVDAPRSSLEPGRPGAAQPAAVEAAATPASAMAVSSSISLGPPQPMSTTMSMAPVATAPSSDGAWRVPAMLGAAAVVIVMIAAGAWLALQQGNEPIARSLATEVPSALVTTTGSAPPTTPADVPTTPVAEPTTVPATTVPATVVPATIVPATVVPATTVAPTTTAPPRTTAPATTVPSATGSEVRHGTIPPTTTSGDPHRTRTTRRPPHTTATSSDGVPLAEEW